MNRTCLACGKPTFRSFVSPTQDDAMYARLSEWGYCLGHNTSGEDQ